MKTILLFGAGKSASILITYLHHHSFTHHWQLIVCDADLQLATSKTKGMQNAQAIRFDVTNQDQRATWIRRASVVISMLPPKLHLLVAADCVVYGKHLLTPSYATRELQEMHETLIQKELIFLPEMGLDPGIDHMSAMELFEKIKEEGGKVTSFVSHCGGLIAPESDTNPWHYKVTWNPGNIVSAGSSGAEYLLENKEVQIPYERVFSDDTRRVTNPDLQNLAWYPNRDSLSYLPLYQLEHVHTFIRTTLRHPAFCRGWNVVVQLGLTHGDDAEIVKDCRTFRDWFNLKRKLSGLQLCQDGELTNQFHFLGLLSDEALPAKSLSSAKILQHLLEKNLGMLPGDRDMVVMIHEVGYEMDGAQKKVTSILAVKGEDELNTAMAKTVGLPLGIACKMILTGELQARGLVMPLHPEVYKPAMKELAENGIVFREYA